MRIVLGVFLLHSVSIPNSIYNICPGRIQEEGKKKLCHKFQSLGPITEKTIIAPTYSFLLWNSFHLSTQVLVLTQTEFDVCKEIALNWKSCICKPLAGFFWRHAAFEKESANASGSLWRSPPFGFREARVKQSRAGTALCEPGCRVISWRVVSSPRKPLPVRNGCTALKCGGDEAFMETAIFPQWRLRVVLAGTTFRKTTRLLSFTTTHVNQSVHSFL